MAASYVKFLRGTVSAYNALVQKDNNTLYFIYENANDTTGKLYLGSKLISGGTSVNIASLTDLADVNINPALLTDGMLLQYNGSTGQGTWEPVSVSQALANVHFDGSIQVETGVTQTGEDQAAALTRIIPSPNEGDIVFLDRKVLIYNGESWQTVNDFGLTDRITALETAIGAPSAQDAPATGIYSELESLDTRLDNVYTKAEVNTAIANTNHLSFTVVSSIEDIDLVNGSENIIYLVPKETSEENDVYDEYMLVNHELEKMGEWGTNFSGTIDASHVTNLTQAIQNNQFIKSVNSNSFTVDANGQLNFTANLDLSNYVLKSTVGDLNDLLDRASANSTLVDEINLINDKLKWKPIENT